MNECVVNEKPMSHIGDVSKWVEVQNASQIRTKVKFLGFLNDGKNIMYKIIKDILYYIRYPLFTLL